MHKITIIGHLGRDPEMRYAPEGQQVTTFSVVSKKRMDSPSGQLSSSNLENLDR